MAGAEAIAATYLDAVLAGDRSRAGEVTAQARAEGMDIRTLYLEVYQPVLREVGRLWAENRITVAEEHLATAITQSLMSRMYDELFRQPRAQRRSLIAACVDVERHEMGLRMVCDLLELEGWNTVYLGATVPVGSLVQMVRQRRPDVVALSVALAPHLPRLRHTIRALREELGVAVPLIMVGGRPFLDDPGMVQYTGADLTAADAAAAVDRLQEHFA